MHRLIIASLIGMSAANNIVSPATKLCLDIKRMCADGSDKKGCEREKSKDLKKGAGLHMWPCHNDENQNFEIIAGRIKNKAAGRAAEHAELCIDIKANCKNGKEEDGCERQSVTELKEDAEIQLWTCRNDKADEGQKSNSYGNQKWDLLGNGYFKNELTGLCLVAHHDDEESGADATNGAKVHVHKCPEGETPDPEFVFDFETGDLAAETNDASDNTERLFSVMPMLKAKASSPVPLMAAATVALALVGAVAAFVRSRRTQAVGQLPLTSCE